MAYVIKNSFRGGIIDESLSARIDLEKYNQSCKALNNFVLQPQGGVYRRPGLRYIAEPNVDVSPTPPAGQPTLIPFIYNSATSYIVVLLNYAFSVYKDQTFIDGDVSFFTTAQNKIADHAQSADVLFLVNQDETPFKIVRTSTSPDVFEAKLFHFESGPTADKVQPPTLFTGIFTGGAGNFTAEYAITSVTDDGGESLPVFYTQPNSKSPLAWAANNLETLSWVAPIVPGGGPFPDSYNLYKLKGGIYGYIGNTRQIAGSPALTFEDLNYDPIISDSIPEAYNPFLSEYPGVVALFQQRLWLAATASKNQTIFASRIGDFENMNFSPFIRPDDSIENTISSGRVDGIRWLAPFNKTMKVGSLERQWDLKSASGGAITPTDINIEPELEWGCAKIKPVLAGNSLLYVEDKGAKLFDIFESQEYQGFTGNNLSVNAPELFEGFSIVSMAYQRTPDPIVWCVRSDGKVVALTYLKNEDVWGWHKHETDGFFRSVTVIPGTNYDEVYFIIERVIETISRYYLEMLEDKWDGADIGDAKFLDSMITKEDVTPFTLIGGVDHLNGEYVRVFGDGEYIPGPHPGGTYLVVAGFVQPELADGVNKAYVGLPYTSTMAPISSEFATQQQGASLGKTKTISDITLRFKTSKGGKIGPRLDYLDSIKTIDYDSSVEGFTGDVKITYPDQFNTDGSFFVVQDEPLPMAIQALFINMRMGER